MYADQDQILDTDYDTYVVFYGCQQVEDWINEDGLLKEEVEQIIMDATLAGAE